MLLHDSSYRLKICKKSIKSILEEPSAIQLELILKDINETSEHQLKHNEKYIQNWISYQTHFPKHVDPLFIRTTLRFSKHNLEKTKQKLENHLAARHLYPEIYKNRSPVSQEILQAMNTVNISFMPKLTSKGNRVIVSSLNQYDPSEFNTYNCAKLFFMTIDLCFSCDYICAGDILIFDTTNFSVNHITRFFGPVFKIISALPKQAYAVRVKQMHFVNAPSAFVKMIGLIKKLSHPKVREAIYVHESPEQLLEAVGAQYLPSNYGGELRSLREITLNGYNFLIENANWFEEQENVQISCIPKNVQSIFTLGNEFGVEGSFRKLNID
ncbi:alpha-tocopherol transfer protein-like [Euwallacea similis]|uniref:alpha-tocopherol transfer protein-like n=1 Tax=Euwallacea similis TaxID=1736056 RepID=UPI00344CAC81